MQESRGRGRWKHLVSHTAPKVRKQRTHAATQLPSLGFFSLFMQFRIPVRGWRHPWWAGLAPSMNNNPNNLPQTYTETHLAGDSRFCELTITTNHHIMFPVDRAPEGTTTWGLKNVCSPVEILKGPHCNKSYSKENKMRQWVRAHVVLWSCLIQHHIKMAIA